MPATRLRDRLWKLLEPDGSPSGAARTVQEVLIGAILVSVAIAAALTVEPLRARIGGWLLGAEWALVALFTVEYVARLASCTAGPAAGSPVLGRVRHALRPMMLIDLLAILPAYLMLLPVAGAPLRVLRLMRIFRLAKLGRYPRAMTLLREAVERRKEELAVTVGAMGVLLIGASFLLYELERHAQPEAFSSVPAALWWAVATLTTVGYGDVYPMTVAGKVMGAVVALLCVGVVGLPTAIFAGSFIETVQDRREQERREDAKPYRFCPHCGEALPHAPAQDAPKRAA